MEKRCRDWNVDQQMLLPLSVRDFVPAGHLAHFVRELVQNELNLESIEGEYTEARGAPPYSPRMLTALLLYGFTQGVYSARKLARACRERVDFMAVTGLNQPKFRAIAEFRKRHLEALGGLFVEVLRLCIEARLVKLGHVAIDGTRISANASMSKGVTYKNIPEKEARLRQEVQEWFEKARACDEEEDKALGAENEDDEALPSWVTNKEERRRRLLEAKKSLEEKAKKSAGEREEAVRQGKKPPQKIKKTDKPKPESRYNFTDPESGIHRTRKGFIQGYNAQIGVDSESYVIVSSHVSTEKNDLNELLPALEQMKETTGRVPAEVSCDAGYCSTENIATLERENIRGYIALGVVPTEREKRISENSAYSRMRKRLRQGAKRSRYRLRGRTVEPVFGILKSARNFTSFLLRGFKQAHHQWRLVCCAYNIMKLHAARG